MRGSVGIALVIFMCAGYTVVSTKKWRTIKDIQNELVVLTNEYENERMEILESGEREYNVRQALHGLQQSFKWKKNILEEILNRKIKKKEKRLARVSKKEETQRTKMTVLKRKH